jgi:hypothetical protein
LPEGAELCGRHPEPDEREPRELREGGERRELRGGGALEVELAESAEVGER